MNSGKYLHLILKVFNSITGEILLQITRKSKEPEIICSRLSQTPGHLASSKVTDSTVLSKYTTLPFKVFKIKLFIFSNCFTLYQFEEHDIIVDCPLVCLIPSDSKKFSLALSLSYSCSTILETQADLTTSESNINSLAYTELRAAKDTGLLEELVKATANQTLLAYPSMTSEHRALYQ